MLERPTVQNLFADPFSLIMLALIAVLIIFMVRNGKKRQQAAQEMQSGLIPGAEVMLQSGIYGTVEEINEEDNRVTLRSGTSTLVVHRNAVSTIVTPSDADVAVAETVHPDDDPAFGEHVDAAKADEPAAPEFHSPFDGSTEQTGENTTAAGEDDEKNGDAAPKA